MCETSFITVTCTQMHYLATNVRQDLGVHSPLGHSRCVWVGLTYSDDMEFHAFLWKKNLCFFIFWRETYQKTKLYPLRFPPIEGRQNDKKPSKNGQNRLQRWHFFGIFGIFLTVGTWVSIFFGIMTWQKHWNNHWNEKKKIENFVKIVFFFDKFV